MLPRSLRSALGEIRRHPWRTFLAAQGVLWAVALSVIPAAILDGSRRQALARARELGTDRIEIHPDYGAEAGQFPIEDDLPSLRMAAGAATTISALRVASARVAGAQEPIWILGADTDLMVARNLRLLAGRRPSPEESAPGAVVEAAVEARLAGVLGAETEILGRRYLLESDASGLGLAPLLPAESPPRTGTVVEICAVLSDEFGKGVDAFGYSEGHMFSEGIRELLQLVGVEPVRPPWLESGMGIYLPRQLVPGQELQWLFVATEPLEIERTSERLERALVERGRNVVLAANSIWKIFLRPELDGYLVLHDVLAGIFGGIGFLVMANLLLLEGWQRRREIALRRVEGATRGDIFRHFLWEGVLLAFVGLAAGLPAGMGIAYLRAAFDPNVAIGLAWPWGAVFRAFSVLGAGALVACSYPAWQASRHAPMALFRKGA